MLTSGQSFRPCLASFPLRAPGRTTLPSRGRGVPRASTRHPRASVRAAATRAGSGIVPKEDIPPRYCAPSDKCAARISDLLTRKKTHPANLDPQDCAPSFPQVTSRPVTERVWLKEQHGPPRNDSSRHSLRLCRNSSAVPATVHPHCRIGGTHCAQHPQKDRTHGWCRRGRRHPRSHHRHRRMSPPRRGRSAPTRRRRSRPVPAPSPSPSTASR